MNLASQLAMALRVEIGLLGQWLCAHGQLLELRPVLLNCGKFAIHNEAGFEDPELSSLKEVGVELLHNIQHAQSKIRELSEQLGRLDERSQAQAVADIRAQLKEWRSSLKDNEGKLTACAKKLGCQIIVPFLGLGSAEQEELCARTTGGRVVPPSAGQPDRRFSAFHERACKPASAYFEARRRTAQLRRQRGELRSALGFDVRKSAAAVTCLLAVGMSLAAFWTGSSGTNSAGHAGAPSRGPFRTLVIIVPGTYGNDQFWPNTLDGMASFGSEVRRSLPVKSEVIPFLWAGSNDHHSRMVAAAGLAALIDERAAGFDGVCLVGHSHGGNIALAAAGMCRARIDAVVCLSTPHVYVPMQGVEGRKVFVPVYCSWEARRNIRSIVSICPEGGDDAIDLAGVLTGLDDDVATAMTRRWQEHLNYPRLLDDGPFAGSVIDTSPLLSAADENVTTSSFVQGLARHSAAHSRRMGGVIGRLLQAKESDEQIQYLRTLAQPPEEDAGDPITLAEWDASLRRRAPLFEHVGWLLKKITVHLLPEANRLAGNDDGISPTPYVRITSEDGTEPWRTQADQANFNATWNTGFMLYAGQRKVLQVYDAHLLRADTYLGGWNLSAPTDTLPADVGHQVYWSAQLEWMQVHY